MSHEKYVPRLYTYFFFFIDSIDDFKVPVICIDDSNVSQEKSVEVNDTVWHTAIETSQENINEINSSSVGTFDTDLTTESTCFHVIQFIV